MRVAVTGALGHIGSRLIRALPDVVPCDELLLLDDFSCQRYTSLFNLPPGVTTYRFIETDVASADLKNLFAGYDTVIHLAAITDAAGSFEKRQQVELNNLGTTRNVAEACAAIGARMISLSSTSVYGTQKEWVDESCSAEELSPQSPYAETKLREEELLRTMRAENSDFRFVALRLGTIFGVSPGMRFHTAVNKFCWQAAVGVPITVWTTAYDQLRPYLDLEDAMAAIAHVISAQLFDGEIYNVVTLNTSVREIVTEIRKHVPKLDIQYVNTEIMNQLSYRVLSEKFAATGFTASGDISRGISDTLTLLSGVVAAERRYA